MGNETTKDKFIQIYLQLDKEYYIAGENITGTIFISATKPRPYSVLNLTFYGNQNNNIGKQELKFEICNFTTPIHDFGGNVSPKQYAFPFSFISSADLPGSFDLVDEKMKSCIKYELKATIYHAKMTNNIFCMTTVAILEPCRLKLGKIATNKSVNSIQKYLCCRKDLGETVISLESSQSFIVSQQMFKINCTIDNRKCFSTVQNIVITFKQMQVGLKPNNELKTKNIYSIIIGRRQKEIPPGSVEEFNFTALVPADNSSYTAIGFTIARYFVIQITAQYKHNQIISEILPIIYQSKNPKVAKVPTPKFPDLWSPQNYPIAQCGSMPTFFYRSSDSLPCLNRSKQFSQNIPDRNIKEIRKMNNRNPSMQELNKESVQHHPYFYNTP